VLSKPHPLAAPTVSTSRRATAVSLVVTGALSVQFGAAIAVLLFPRVGALGVVSLRLALSAIPLWLIFRPRLTGRNRADWALVLAFGGVLAGMNVLFYQAIERIPLGTAVTIEVLGPLALSVFSSRKLLSWVWAALALAGVALLGGGLTGLSVPGVLFALGAGVLWAAYIVLSARSGRRFQGADGLALSMGVATVLTLPLGILAAGSVLFQPAVLLTGLTIAVLSSSIPYTLELFALRTIPASTFAILVSLGPAIGATSGFLILHQRLGAIDLVAMSLVIAASAGAVLTSSTRARPAIVPALA
jgi:inner membrane transporter RhtA